MSDIAAVTEKLPLQPETAFPDAPFYQGPEAPCRFEAEVYNCVVRGTIPQEVQGTYYRCMPDALWAPQYEDDVFINGDGAIDAIRIKDGHADFKQKYVRTSKFVIERAARQAVFGKYRNRYTDDPRVKHEIHSTANTHIIYFEKQLLALKEDSPPYAMDPNTLEMKGPYDFHGPGPPPEVSISVCLTVDGEPSSGRFRVRTSYLRSSVPKEAEGTKCRTTDTISPYRSFEV